MIDNREIFRLDLLENLGEFHFPPYFGENLESDGICGLEAAQQLLTVRFHPFPTFIHLTAAHSDCLKH